MTQPQLDQSDRNQLERLIQRAIGNATKMAQVRDTAIKNCPTTILRKRQHELNEERKTISAEINSRFGTDIRL